MPLFGRSRAREYQDRKPGISGLLRSDSIVIRILIFAAMGAIFFLLLKMTEQKIPRGLAPDSTDVDTAKAPPALHQSK